MRTPPRRLGGVGDEWAMPASASRHLWPSGQETADGTRLLKRGPREALPGDGRLLPAGLSLVIRALEGDHDTIGENSFHPYGVRANPQHLSGRALDLDHSGTLLVELIPRAKLPGRSFLVNNPFRSLFSAASPL